MVDGSLINKTKKGLGFHILSDAHRTTFAPALMPSLVKKADFVRSGRCFQDSDPQKCALLIYEI